MDREPMKRILIITSFIFLVSCAGDSAFERSMKIDDAAFKGEVSLERIEKLDKYKLTVFNQLTGKVDQIYTPYQVLQMELADVNRDGRTDICLGIIKPTPFDSALKRRLFIFEIDRDYIRPLWLSSRLVKPLEEFVPFTDEEGLWRILAMEREGNDLYCLNEYKWGAFGMSFQKQVGESLDYHTAKDVLEKYTKRHKHKST